MPCIAQRNRPLLLQGTLTTFRRRCGKPTCRCAAGEPHESPALRFTEDGRTKTLEEIGDRVGVTRERIRQIQEEAVKKMRVKIAEHETPAVETASMAA